MELRYGSVEDNVHPSSSGKQDSEDDEPFLVKNLMDTVPHRSSSPLLRISLLLLALYASLSFLWIILRGPLQEDLYYDYIVVGAGPAGIVCAVTLARRVEEDGGRVLLLESGEESQTSVLQALDDQDHRRRGNSRKMKKGDMASMKSPTVASSSINVEASQEILRRSNGSHIRETVNDFDVPLFWHTLSDHRDTNYYNHHWPIPNAIVGRAVGGSGIHNAMINVRALSSDFDVRWNIPKWNASKMMTYYNALETYEVSSSILPFWNHTTTHHRGTSGPLMTVPAGQSVDPVASAFIEASLASGIPLASLGFNDVQNETKRIGAGVYEFNIREGVRDSAASAFLRDIPSNLEIRRGATVTKVLFDSSSGGEPQLQRLDAIGVQYLNKHGGLLQKVFLRPSSHTFKEKKGHRPSEIILSGGAIMTPQILANSGIREGGNVVDLAGVGKNLQDHPAIAIAFSMQHKLFEEVSTYWDEYSNSFDDYLNFVEETTKTSSNFQAEERQVEGEDDSHSGLFGTAGFSAGAFLKSPWSHPHNVPDIQLTVFSKRLEPHFVASTHVSSNSDPSKEMLVTVALLDADGRYELQLSEEMDSQQLKVPKIVPVNGTYLTERDIDRLVWGLEEVRRIQKSNPLREYTKDEFYPGAGIHGQELRKFIHQNAMNNAHWCGTTRMGHTSTKEDDKMTVVDEDLKVQGVNRLRVVDAGVMPRIPNGNTHSTTCAVALHAVDLILDK